MIRKNKITKKTKGQKKKTLGPETRAFHAEALRLLGEEEAEIVINHSSDVRGVVEKIHLTKAQKGLISNMTTKLRDAEGLLATAIEKFGPKSKQVKTRLQKNAAGYEYVRQQISDLRTQPSAPKDDADAKARLIALEKIVISDEVVDQEKVEKARNNTGRFDRREIFGTLKPEEKKKLGWDSKDTENIVEDFWKEEE